MPVGRNDACFCGSGKKYKKCHPDINDQSMVANVYKYYHKVDSDIEDKLKRENITPVCHEGCHQCCSHFFHISEAEISLILEYIYSKKGLNSLLDYLKRGEIHWKAFKEEFPEYAKNDETKVSGKTDNVMAVVVKDMEGIPVKTSLPCVFLNEETKLCDIYPVRPFVCRTHGVGYMIHATEDYAICENMDSWVKYRDRMVDIDEIGKGIVNFEMIESEKHDTSLYFRPHSIISFLHYYHGLNETMPIQERQNFRAPFMMTKEQYVNLIIEKST